MDSNIYALLKMAWAVSKSQGANVYGVEIGIVTNVKDPDQQGRVKVCFPRLQGNPESDWARVSQPAAGDGRGFYWLPQVNDEVLVAFERGQANCPYVIGSLWNGKDKPMKDAYSDENTIEMIQTRSGHQIALYDKAGEEKIVIADKTGKRTLTFDVKAKKFLVEAKEGDLELHAKKKIVIDCEDLEIKTSKKGKADIGTTFDLKVSQKAQLKAGPQMNLKASKVQLNPSELTIEALVAAAVGAAAGAAAAAATGGNVAQGAAAGAAAGYSAAGPGGSGIVPSTDVLKQAVTGGAQAGAETAGPAGKGGVEATEWTKAREGPAAGAAGGEPGAKAAVAAESKKVIQGAFLVGEHVVKCATFRLHKDSADGPLVTPDNLVGKTELQWGDDHWVTGDDGKYRFTDLAGGKYFVELFGKPEEEE